MSLPDDVVHEILVRLKNDVASLFRCASTCKRWSRLVAEVRRPDHPSSSSSFLAGFFIRKRIGVFSTDRSSMTSVVPTPGWVFQPHRRFLGSFFPETAAGGHLGRAVPLVAHHGLLLARLPSPDLEIDRSTGGRRRSSTAHLVVCNLLAGTWATLPPLERNWRYWDRCCRNWRYGDTGYAILTEVDRSSSINRPSSTRPPAGYSPLFKVLVIYTNSGSCILNTFSSGEARWNTPINIGSVTGKPNIWGPLKHPSAVVSRGTAHWLVSSDRDDMHIVAVDAQTGHVTVEKIVIVSEHFSQRHCDEPHLSVAADGTLALLYVQRPGLRLNVFVPQDGPGPRGWLLSRVVELKPPEQRMPNQEAQLTFIGEKCGTLLVRDSTMRLYAADLETGMMTELTFCGLVNRWNVVPFEIYWPSTFF
ncbi:hypothetical protein QYE76_047335 [Lolium multiflorum]|uniref:F-box domain-containing protein n=1 Tax=Lolium multiflorum TaxID=4521 RepID=A0AAD8TRJ4_LOLMU|nr:hypothetical protein QYE76_047335 [Lolium multiflorum]